VKEFVEQLVREARAQRGSSPSCIPSGQAPKIATAQHDGWSFVLDVYDHPGSNGETVEHFRLSAKLFPPGRGSTEQDWGALGALVAAVQNATGGGGAEPVLPLEEIHPNATILWTWHADGSAVDPVLLTEMARVLRAMQSAPSRAPVAAVSPAEPGRNEPCPCGSGKKFKKCHGGN
jgi:hypothetical protein